jgi:hypothetical protein
MFLTAINPHTNKLMNLFSDQVNHLLSNGYTILDVMNLFKQIPSCYHRNNIFSNDLFINYAMHLELVDIVSLCSVDKHARMVLDNKQLWEYKMKRSTNYFIPEYNGLNYKKALDANKLISMYENCSIMLDFGKDDLTEIINHIQYIPGNYVRQRIYIDICNDSYNVDLYAGDTNITTLLRNNISFNKRQTFIFTTFFNNPNIIHKKH